MDLWPLQGKVVFLFYKWLRHRTYTEVQLNENSMVDSFTTDVLRWPVSKPSFIWKEKHTVICEPPPNYSSAVVTWPWKNIETAGWICQEFFNSLAMSKKERTLFRKIRQLHNARNPRINIFLSGKIQQYLEVSQKTPWYHDLKIKKKKKKKERCPSLSFVENIPGNSRILRHCITFS